MKTNKNIILSLVICFFAQLLCANSNPDKTSDSQDILVKGKIFYEEYLLKTVVVNLYDQNKLVHQTTLNSSHNVNLNLARDKDYTIEILAEGFFDKRLKISTKHLKMDSKPSIIKFNATLLSKSNFKNPDDFLMDFPWAVFEYDTHTNQFIIDKNYTEIMLQEISSLYE